MKIVIPQERLLTELSLAHDVIDRKVTIPVLSHVLLRAEGNTLTLSATNLDAALVSRVEADIVKPGAVCVQADLFTALIGRVADDVTLELDGDRLKVTASGSTARVPTMPAADFVTAPFDRTEANDVLAISTGVLIGLVKRARFAMDSNGGSAHAGALCEVEGADFRIVSCDGHQLALSVAKLVTPAAAAVRSSLSAAGWSTLLKWLGVEASTQPVSLAVSDKRLWWSTPARTVSIGVLDKIFPAYARIIPQTKAFTVEVPRLHLQEVLRRHVIFADRKAPKVLMAFEPNGVKLETHTSDGEIDDLIALPNDGGGMRMCVNPRYLLSVLDAFDAGDTLSLSLKDEVTAMTWKAAAQDDSLALVMPMRV